MTWLTDAYNVLFRPGLGLERVLDRGRLGGAALAVLLAGALLGIQAAAAAGMGIAGGVVLGFILAGAAWFVGGTLWHGTAGIVGGEGAWRQLLTGLGWASLPLILLPVATTLGRWWVPIGGLLKLAILIWVIILAVQAVRRAENLTTGRSLGSLALIGLLLLLAPLSIGMLTLIGMAS